MKLFFGVTDLMSLYSVSIFQGDNFKLCLDYTPLDSCQTHQELDFAHIEGVGAANVIG